MWRWKLRALLLTKQMATKGDALVDQAIKDVSARLN